ncbi:hypothetical protein HMI54_010726, partial [Coelomomyces lativittatus]
MVCSIHIGEVEEQTVTAFMVNKSQDTDMNGMIEKMNSNFFMYREMAERANDLLMDAFISGTTEVLNSKSLSATGHYNSMVKKKTREAGQQVSNLQKESCPLEEYLQYDVGTK